MKIVVDENMPHAVELFAEFGEVIPLSGRHMQAADLQDADVLLVRSVTRVDAALLATSPRLGFVGTATIGTDHVDKALLADMAQHWSFLQSALANLEMVLAKSDLGIAARYLPLVEDQAKAETLFGRIREGWSLTHDGLLAATGQSRLLERSPTTETSIRLRLPYIEPLNLLQVELLKRYRAGEDDARIKEGIELSINAIATALRNSG